MNNGILILGSLGITGLLVGGILWIEQKGQERDIARLNIEIDGVEVYTDLARGHVSTDVDYPQTPAVGGIHASVWLGCNGNIYDEPVPDEQAVHAMEHGAVWISYDPENINDEDKQSLLGKRSSYTFVSPVPGQPSPIMMTAWGVQLGVNSVTDDRLDLFLEKFRQGPQTPEPGATCSPVPGGLS